MGDDVTATERPHRGWPEKREAIAEAAVEVFLREGYVRASMAGIATSAGVSKRTLYKHYEDKEHLFRSVVQEMMSPIVARFAQLARNRLSEVEDVRESLVAFGLDWVSSVLLAPELSALRRLLIAEAGHFPSVVDAWRQAGPDLGQQELVEQLERLDAAGRLSIPDAVVAADHLGALVLFAPTNRSLMGAITLDMDAQMDKHVRNAVDAFLRIYGPRLERG